MKAIICLALVLLTSSLFAQWSEDPASPSFLAGGGGEQVMPKTAITTDGKVYVCRFDNSATGNYDVYLQLFNQQGVSQWAAGGILVSNQPSMTWLTDYDITVDQDGNAIITFQDIRSLGVNNIVVYKVSPEGAMLWGPDGIALSYDLDTNYASYSPKVLSASDNSCYVAWQRTGSANDEIYIQRLSSTGQKLWGENGITVASAAGKYTWPQLIESSNGDILLKYYVDSGPYWAPTRHLFVTRINDQGIAAWNTTVSNAGGISAWTQILGFQPDGTGGAVLSWYDDRNNDMVNEAYIAHVAGDGSITTPDNGALITGVTGNQQYNPVITVDAEQQRIYAFFQATSSDQNQRGICRQLLDYAGNRLWTDSGEMMIPLSAYVVAPLYCYQTSLGIVVVYEEGTEPNNDQSMMLKASCFRNSGQSPFNAVPVATNASNKYHFDFAAYSDGWISLVWEQGTADNDIYGARLNSDGSIGMVYPAPAELHATLVSPSEIQLAWLAPSPGYPPVSYQIFMNNELLQVVDAPQTQFNVTDLTPGSYSFYIVAVYPGNHYSEHSNIAEIIVVSNSDDTIPHPGLQLSIWPNPIRQMGELKFFCKDSNPVNLSLYNLKGQKVETLTLGNSKAGWNSFTWIPSSKLPAGVYFLLGESTTELQVKKLVIQ